MEKRISHPKPAFAIMAALVLAVAACTDEKTERTITPTPAQLPDASLFPVVLDRDVLVVAAADGSSIEERPVLTSSRPLSEGVSPDGRRTASYRRGMLYVQEGAEEPQAIVSIEHDTDDFFLPIFFWSPDSTRFAYVQGGQMYVVGADGTGPTLVGESKPVDFLTGVLTLQVGGDGARWSPDGSRIATHGPTGVRVLSTKGATPIDFAAGWPSHVSWSPDSQLLAFDSGEEIIIANVAAPGNTRVLTQGSWPRWSPAGDRIAFKRGGHAFTIRPDGTGLANLGDTSDGLFDDFTWSTDGRQLEFVRRGPDLQLYAVDLRTAAVTRFPAGTVGPLAIEDSGCCGQRSFWAYPYGWLTTRKEYYVRHGLLRFHLEFSPDGQRVALRGYPPSGWFVIELSSGEHQQLAEGVVVSDGESISPYGPDDFHWSSDGVRVAYPAGESGVFVAEGDGSPPRRVATLVASDVAWSPDGEKVATSTGSGITVVSMDGAELLSIGVGTLDSSDTIDGLRWSPDGTRFLYQVNRGYEPFGGDLTSQVFVTGLDEAPLQALTGADVIASGATWSPDGRTIAYRQNGGIWLVGADGGNARRLSDSGGGGELLWSPDGTMIATGGLEVSIIDVATGAVMSVAEGVGAWPVFDCWGRLGWAPDSQSIYVASSCFSF